MSDTILDFQARAEARLRAHDARVRAPLERDLKRARRSIESLRATLDMERDRMRAALVRLEELERAASHAGPSREWFTAISALLRVRGAE